MRVGDVYFAATHVVFVTNTHIVTVIYSDTISRTVHHCYANPLVFINFTRNGFAVINNEQLFGIVIVIFELLMYYLYGNY